MGTVGRKREPDAERDEYTAILGERITAIRKRERLSQADVARYMGVKLDTYKKWETGKRQFPMHKLLDFCILTRARVSPIVTGREDGDWFGEGTGTFRRPKLRIQR